MSVPTWLTRPEAPAKAVGAPPPSDLAWARQKTLLCVSLLADLRPRIVESGDPADQAVRMVMQWLVALRDHPKHGVNWLAKHGDELGRLVRPLFPSAFPPPPVRTPAPAPVRILGEDPDADIEGADLYAALGMLFPDARVAGPLDLYYRKVADLGRSTPTSRDVCSPAPAREKEPESGV